MCSRNGWRFRVDDDELAALKVIASRLLDLGDDHLANDLNLGTLKEICDETKPHHH
jgi:hypothetical protein